MLGPLLWDFAYDEILRVPLLDCTVVCYAKDTLLLVGGEG